MNAFGLLAISALCVADLLDWAEEGCGGPWFGSRCQYECHCEEEGTCDKDGACLKGCEKGWFGPACQYVDLALDSKGLDDVIRDGLDSTCEELSEKSLKISFNKPIWFTWMLLVVDGSAVHPEYTIGGEAGGFTSQVVMPADTIVRSKDVSETHAEFGTRIDTLTLTFTREKVKVCSVYVSGGRNVALKQTASQSSTHEGFGARLAVDGNRGDKDVQQASCAVTKDPEVDSHPFWSLEFSQRMLVDRYVLVNKGQGKNMCGYQLQAWYQGRQTQMYHHKKDDGQEDNSVNEIRLPVSSVVSTLNLTFPEDNWKTGVNPCGLPREISAWLSICEFSAFGDSICPAGRWGLDCDKKCECKGATDHCYVSTGRGCMEEMGCKEGYWGQDCDKGCPNSCKGGICRAKNGKCFNCSDRHFDPIGDMSCIGMCSEKCAGKGNCDVHRGECLEGCQEGYMEPGCVKPPDIQHVREIEKKSIYGILSAILIFIFISAILIALAIWVVRRMRRNRDSHNESPPEPHVPQNRVVERKPVETASDFNGDNWDTAV